MNKIAEIENMNKKLAQQEQSPLKKFEEEGKSPLKNMKREPEYHVSYNEATGTIYSGVVNKKGNKWLHKSNVTQECLSAVRDHFINILSHQEENTEIVGYQWKTQDGKVVTLQLVVTEEAKDGEV